MANEEHLAILKQGVAKWNQWRAENPDTAPDLSHTNLTGADILAGPRSSGFSVPDLSGANLGGADLTRTNFTVVYLFGTDLQGANLSGACLQNVHLAGANLRKANLSGVYVFGSNLIETNLNLADLNLATFSLTNLSGVNFSGAHIGGTAFANVDMNRAKGLESINYESPSSVGVDTLALTLRGSGGRFTDEQLTFFEGAGVSTTLLEYLPSILETDPLQFYACFISYSTRDEWFAEPLDQDLNEAGIKTWKWDRDAVRGRDLAQSIDVAIRNHDKTILVCSANSLTSPQVEQEIQRALDKEVQIKTANAERRKEALSRGEPPPTVDADVLIPIRLDDTIFNWDSHLKSEVTRRMVADFTNASPGSDKYNRELQALIKALNPTSWPPVAVR